MDDADKGGMRQALIVARRRWKIVLVVPLVALVAGVAFTRMQTPQYEATAILLAGQGGGQVGTIDQVESATRAATALAAMSTDRVVLREALDSLHSPSMSVSTLQQRVHATVPVDSQKIEIAVTDTDPIRARDLANAIADSFAALVTREKVAKLNLSASVWQRAATPTSPVSPRPAINYVAALLVGLVCASVLAYAREMIDGSWRNEHDVESDLALPVLAVIPMIKAHNGRKVGVRA